MAAPPAAPTAPTAPTAPPAKRRGRTPRQAASVLLMLGGFAAAVVLRCAVGGSGVARSRTAGLVFAGALLLLVAALGERPTRRGSTSWAWRAQAALLIGVPGAVVLCVPATVSVLGRLADFSPSGRPGFVGWAAVVTVVATAEEVFLRGTLYRLLMPYGTAVAIVVPALAFAALHVPLYGWGAVPLDLAVGVWLGALRASAGTVAAPAVAHVLADWAAWGLL